MLGDGQHHLGHAVAASLGREAADQRAVDQSADHRRQDHEPHPQPGDVRIGRVAGGAVVTVPAEDLREAENQVAERDRTGTGTDADRDRERDEPLAAHQPPARALRHPLGREGSRARLSRRRSRGDAPCDCSA